MVPVVGPPVGGGHQAGHLQHGVSSQRDGHSAVDCTLDTGMWTLGSEYLTLGREYLLLGLPPHPGEGVSPGQVWLQEGHTPGGRYQ